MSIEFQISKSNYLNSIEHRSVMVDHCGCKTSLSQLIIFETGVVPNTWQARIWANDDTSEWRIYASPGLNSLLVEYMKMYVSVWIHLFSFHCQMCICWYRYTTTMISSFWRHFRHWLHRKLSFWQLPMQPMTKMSSKWRYFRFSVRCECGKGIRRSSFCRLVVYMLYTYDIPTSLHNVVSIFALPIHSH